MTSVCGIPNELLFKPKALIGLIGLDIIHNPVHKSIWEAFTIKRRNDRVPLHFKIFPGDHEFPKSKTKRDPHNQKRTSYDWYVPKGLLKTCWLRKHLEEVPAVAAVFFDLDWDETSWKERREKCAERVEAVRKSLANRGTKVAVVLIQKRAPLPPGEDMTAAERAQALCNECDLPPKNLYVLPHTDYLNGYIMRLETAFNDLAMNYYHNEAKKVKAHKEHINKTTHQLLFVRHQIKIAFFNELKQDTSLPIKHYRQAYTHLLELRMHDTHLLEIKTVAGFINYKICRLSFQINATEAISQFRKHTEFFKSQIGIAELAFEHEAWMSKQFELLGDLFHKAIGDGLTALMTQHPGLYYLEAARHAISRRRLVQSLCQVSRGVLAAFLVDSPSSHGGGSQTDQHLASAQLSQSMLEFYGQRMWRQGNQNNDPPDLGKEREGILSLQAKEAEVQHSSIIIPLLKNAVTQYEKYKAQRMKQYPCVMMGEEYFYSCEYANALGCFSLVTPDFRRERWWTILTSIWTTALKCAFLIGSIAEYISISLELIGKDSFLLSTEKVRVQKNLNSMLQNEIPSPEPGCDGETQMSRARKSWKEAIDSYNRESRDPKQFVINMANVVPCIECKTYFSNESFTADIPVKMSVSFLLTSPLPLAFTKLHLEFSNKTYNEHCICVSKDEQSLQLEPNVIRIFEFSFPAEKEDVGKQIRVESVYAELGNSAHRNHALLHWPCSLEEYHQQPYLPLVPPKPHRTGEPTPPLQWSCISNRPITDIASREPNIEVSLIHQPPLLVNEFYSVEVVVENRESSSISQISLSVGLTDGQDFQLEQTTHLCVSEPEFDGKVVARRVGIQMKTLEPEQKAKERIFIKCSELADRSLTFEVSYVVQMDVLGRLFDSCCSKRETVWLPGIQPLETNVRIHSNRFLPINELIGGEPFILQISLSNASPWEIEVVKSELTLTSPVECVEETLESQVSNVFIKSLESISECQMLVVSEVNSRFSAAIGTYTLHWRRRLPADCIDSSYPVVSTEYPLPSFPVEPVSVGVRAELPSHGVLRSPFPLTYTLDNRTLYPQDLEAQMDLTDGFMYSGNRVLHIRVLPQSCYQLTYNLYPLITGHVELPRLHLKLTRGSISEETLMRSVPTHFFVKPCGMETMNSVV